MFVVMGSGIAHAQEPGPTPAPPADPPEVPAEPEDEDYDPHGVAAMRQDDLDDAAARNRYTVASALYESGRFVESATEFETAFELSQRSSLLFNAYLAWRDAGRLADAVRTLDQYLGETPGAQDHVRLTGRLNAMRMSLEQQTSAEQLAEAERERLAAAAEEERMRADELEAERLRRAQEDGAGPHPVGYVVAAVGLAAVIGGTVAALVADSAHDDFLNDCPGQACPEEFAIEDREDSLRSAQLATDILLIGGGAALVTGIVLLLVVPKGIDETVQPSVSCLGHGCTFHMEGAFK